MSQSSLKWTGSPTEGHYLQSKIKIVAVLTKMDRLSYYLWFVSYVDYSLSQSSLKWTGSPTTEDEFGF